MRCRHLEDLFPELGERDYDHDDVSPRDQNYNCIAWAAGDNTRLWWPIDQGGYWWPPELPKGEETEENFVRAFELLGYRRCRSSALNKKLEKVALYLDEKGTPTHMARQLPNGVWASKCGVSLEDIKHKTLTALEGYRLKNGEDGYGRATVYLHRRKDGKLFFRDKLLAFIDRMLRRR